MDSATDLFDYDAKSFPKNVNSSYLQHGLKLSRDDFLTFNKTWRDQVAAAGLLTIGSFSTNEAKAILNTFVTDLLDSGQLSFPTVPRDWCVLALTAMVRAMKAAEIAKAKKSRSSSSMIIPQSTNPFNVPSSLINSGKVEAHTSSKDTFNLEDFLYERY